MDITTTMTTGDVISSDKVEGTTVYNDAGDKLGSIDDLMIDVSREGYVVPLDEQRLSGAPRYSNADIPAYTPEYSRRVNNYYDYGDPL